MFMESTKDERGFLWYDNEITIVDCSRRVMVMHMRLLERNIGILSYNNSNEAKTL